MSRDDDGKRSYHHGDLRRALVDAVIGLIADKGVGGFTVAEAARAAGVSPAAPYRHFRDRDALVAEVAVKGFDLFADRLAAAWNKGRPNPMAAFEEVGRAYLTFAREERPLFAAMFQPGLPDGPALRAAADRAFNVLLTATETLIAGLPPERRPPAHMVSYHIWALSHGAAELFTGAGPSRSPISAEDLLESGIGVYLMGLGVIHES